MLMSASDRPATLFYQSSSFRVITPGKFVVCAVSGIKIPLEALRYWSAEKQEAYAGPAEALARWKELNP